MIELFVLMLVLGGLLLAGSMIGLVFKLFFGLIGGLFSLLGGLIALFVGSAVMLVLLPVFALALIPMLMPVLLVVGLVWLIVHAANRPHARVQPAPVGRSSTPY